MFQSIVVREPAVDSSSIHLVLIYYIGNEIWVDKYSIYFNVDIISDPCD